VLARRYLRYFVRESWHVTNPGVPLEDAWFVDVVADHVQRQIEEWANARRDPTHIPTLKDLLVNLPPRCAKSTLVSLCATAWAWLDHPEMRIGCLSTNPRVSFRDALAVRTLITSEWYQSWFAPAWTLREDQSAVGNFANTAGGSRVARGFDSNVVGEGFDWILVDDPHDPRDSEGQINAVITGWDVALSSRVNDPRSSIRTSIMQPITEHDFSSHVRAQGWAWLCLAMERKPDEKTPDFPIEVAIDGKLTRRDPRAVGECLHPKRFPPAVLDQRKLELGPYGYAAQYQMEPAPLEGGMIKRDWFKRFSIGEITKDGKLDVDWVTISVDPAGDAEHDGDPVGLLVAAGKGPRRYVLEDASRRMSWLETCAALRALLVTWPQCRKVLVEKSAVGPAIVQTLRKEVNEGALRTIVVEELTTHMIGSKKQRALAMVPALAAGLVNLLDGASWVQAFIGEHALFPNAQHDDRVDALGQLLAHYAPVTDAKTRWKVLGR
jgi:predicted phage terminase large subunit-like protein